MQFNSTFDDLDISTILEELKEQQLFELYNCVQTVVDYERYNVFGSMYPATGDCNIGMYPKHISLLNASAVYREICMLGGNRSGKSVLGAYITTCHATGIYPDWYTGKRFKRATKIWVGGDTATTCRDIIQLKLLGTFGDFGSGMIPKDKIIKTSPRRNVPEAVEIIKVRHVTGGITEIILKTYEQGRETWQGSEVDFIWIDEECPHDVYIEALMRTMTTGGYVFLTFTPLSGLTDVVINFMNNDQNSEAEAKKYLQYVTWDDCGHLSDQLKAELFNALPPHEREARSKGIPTVGAGKIYPVPESDFIIEPIPLPKYFPRAYALDVGWNATAVLWGALDRETDILYIYDEYKKGEAEPYAHASAIKARGEWINGVIDPASRGRSQHDGSKLFEKYLNEGLKITLADNGVETGIYEVWQRLNSGRLKIFSTCKGLLEELRLYRRDDKGKIVKKNDHLCDTLRYLSVSGIQRACVFVDSLRNLRDNKVIPIKTAAWT
jgi:phage terminase large subunit-like protein